MGKHQGGNFKYVEIKIIQTTEGIKVQQNLYIDGVEEIPTSRKRTTEKYAVLKNDEIRSLRALTGQLNWVATQIRPDVSYDVLDLSMKLQKHPTVEDLPTVNKTVKKLKVDQKSGIFFPEMEILKIKNFMCFVMQLMRTYLMDVRAVKDT